MPAPAHKTLLGLWRLELLDRALDPGTAPQMVRAHRGLVLNFAAADLDIQQAESWF